MSAGEAVGTAVFEWARDALGVTINEMFGQTEMNYIVGNSHELWPAKPGSMGRPYPGHRIAVIDDDGRAVADGEIGEVAVNRIAPDGHARSRVLPRVLRQSGRHREEIHRRLVPHRRSRQARRRRLSLVPGTRRRHVQGGRLPDRPVGDRELPRPASGGRQRRRGPLARRNARQRRQGVHRARRRATRRAPALEEDIRQHVRKFLAPYEYPKEIEFIDALPMTTTGKVQRRVLRERERAAQGGGHAMMELRGRASAAARAHRRADGDLPARARATSPPAWATGGTLVVDDAHAATSFRSSAPKRRCRSDVAGEPRLARVCASRARCRSTRPGFSRA